jgi:hypothetical protein
VAGVPDDEAIRIATQAEADRQAKSMEIAA